MPPNDEYRENDENHLLPEALLRWLVHTQQSGLDIIALATYQLPIIGSLDFVDVTDIHPNPPNARPDDIATRLAELLSAKEKPLPNESLPEQSPPQPSTSQIQPSEDLRQVWQSHLQTLSSRHPVKVQRIAGMVLISCLVTQQAEHIACIGCLIAPPLADHMVDMLMLSLGWLFYGLIQQQSEQNERTQKLLHLTGDVLTQTDAQSAAQEWVNQTKQWANQMGYADLGVSLFKVVKHTPKWWVSANISWAVKGSPMMQQALEHASLATTECLPQQTTRWWAYPMHHRGQVSGVLVISRADEIQPFDEHLLRMLTANADLFEPILRQWRQSEQNLISHGYHSSTGFFEKVVGKGYLAYKALTILSILCLLAVTLIPVDAVVNASLYVDGDKRHIVTAPQQGYIVKAMVRPGDVVNQGQLIAQLEDKDLKIESAELNSRLEQSDSQFRQAMAQLDATESGLAVNQKQQLQAKLDLINTKLKRTRITAPINGTVVSGDWQQKIGTPVEVGAELFQIADIHSYRVILHVPDKDMDDLKIGQQGKMKLTSLPEQTFNFTITRLTAVAEVKDGENGFTIEAALESIPTQIRPGMQGVGKVIVGKTNLLSTWTKTLVDWVRLKLWSFW